MINNMLDLLSYGYSDLQPDLIGCVEVITQVFKGIRFQNIHSAQIDPVLGFQRMLDVRPSWQVLAIMFKVSECILKTGLHCR